VRWAVGWVVAAALVAVLGLVAAFGVGLGPRPTRLPAVITPGPTTGSIYVSGPQVYTRERLVNDRYREDAWLLDELKRSTDLTFGFEAHLTTKDTLTASAALNVGRAAAAEASAAPASGNSGAPGAPTNESVEIPPFDRFKALRTYREQIRTLIIENQLDDRHDLRGNSLYRLGFDVAVLPGDNTRRSAKITVSVLPPEGLLGQSVTDATDNQALRAEEVKLAGLSNLDGLGGGEQKAIWERLYMRWLDSVEKRFDENRTALHMPTMTSASRQATTISC